MVPAYVSALSVLILLAHVVKVAFQSRNRLPVFPKNIPLGRLRHQLHAQELGPRLFLYRVIRLATCIALVMLSLISPTPNTSVRAWLLATYVRLHIIVNSYRFLTLGFIRFTPASLHFYQFPPSSPIVGLPGIISTPCSWYLSWFTFIGMYGLWRHMVLTLQTE